MFSGKLVARMTIKTVKNRKKEEKLILKKDTFTFLTGFNFANIKQCYMAKGCDFMKLDY